LILEREPKNQKKRTRKEKKLVSSYPWSPLTKQLLPPEDLQMMTKALRPHVLKNFLSLPGSKEIRAGITPCPFKGTEGLLSKN
jgi:hypothetical protein